MMYQVPPPVAEAFGHELLIAAGRSDDDWSVRASGFAPQSYWGMSSYSNTVIHVLPLATLSRAYDTRLRLEGPHRRLRSD